MQSAAASKRAFSFLASKIHPQLPLSPRESQQLLTLLTTSFRAHLDREHPVTLPDSNHETPPAKHLARRASQHAPQRTSQTTASHHIDSILTNPLFSAPPKRIPSDPSRTDAQEVLKDPMSWFMSQVALGAADIQKAATCLEILQRNAQSETPQPPSRDTRPGARIAEWLWSSGLESSRAFIGSSVLLDKLIPLLVDEGHEAPIWRWIMNNTQAMVTETGLPQDRILVFKAQLLRQLVSSKLTRTTSVDEALAAFIKAAKMFSASRADVANRVLRSAGGVLVNHILARPHFSGSVPTYETFQRTTASGWAKSYTPLIQSLLSLHHPSKPSAAPGLALLKKTAANEATIISLANGSSSHRKREFYVQLCLGVARQTLAEGKFDDAQYSLEFVKTNFPDLVSEPTEATSETQHDAQARQKAQKKQRMEQENLELLDSLLPG